MAAKGGVTIVRFVPGNMDAILCLSAICIVNFCRGAFQLKFEEGKVHRNSMSLIVDII